jgi:hypothetical protein
LPSIAAETVTTAAVRAPLRDTRTLSNPAASDQASHSGYLDLVDFLQWVPLLGALGIGSVVGNYVGAGRARREVRSAMFKTIAEVEKRRWCQHPDGADYPEFLAAVRDLETAALIARLPRTAVQHYVVLAHTARSLSNDAVDFDPTDQTFWGSINGDFDEVVRDTTRVLSRLVWNPWRARLAMHGSLKALRGRAVNFEDARIRRTLAEIQKERGALPGPVGRLPGIAPPTQNQIGEFNS